MTQINKYHGCDALNCFPEVLYTIVKDSIRENVGTNWIKVLVGTGFGIVLAFLIICLFLFAMWIMWIFAKGTSNVLRKVHSYVTKE